jgi:predicted metalloprotease with PDZ domain
VFSIKISRYSLNFIIFTIIATFSIQGNALEYFEHDISYSIKPSMIGKDNCIDISAELKGKTSGEYVLKVPQAIKNINITSTGKAVKYEHVNDSNSKLKVFYPPGEKINLKYGFCQENPSRNVDYPILEKRFKYLPLEAILIFPDENIDNKSKIQMDIDSFPKNFKVVTTFNINNKNYKITESIKNYRRSVVAIGEIEADTFYINDKPIYVMTNGNWRYFNKNPSLILKQIIKRHRIFWQDHDFPYYSVFLIKQNEPPIPKYFMGIHLFHSIVALLPNEEELFDKVLYGISHEASHAWTSDKIKMDKDDVSLLWFFEGFNDLYGLLFAYESGSIQLKDKIDIYNIFIKQYMLSPVKKVAINNSTIIPSRGHYYFISQLRGHFAAKELRDKFNQDDTNKFDLAMKALFENQKKEGWKYLTEDKIDETFISYVGKNEWDKTKHMIKSGELITFSPTAFMPYAKLEMVELDAPIFGFNELDLLDNNVISQIDENSNAYKAGLRNGQKVQFYNIDFKSSDKPLTIQVDDNGAIKTITFLPNVTKKMIPQYVMAKGDVFGKRMRDRG